MPELDLAGEIAELAESQGIDALGFAEASAFADYRLKRSRRRNPALSLPGAKSIVVAGIYIGGLVLPSWDQPHIGRTSRLFLSGFFNDIVSPLEPIVELLKMRGHTALACDTSKPGRSIVPLKLAAIRAGLGWQGKNSLLVNRKFGTFLALGGILTNAELRPVLPPESDHCKGCNRCRDACPMGALAEPYVLNKRKCLSYLLQRDHLPKTARETAGNRIMDCEICQEACPWNAKHLKAPLETGLTAAFRRTATDWEEFFTLARLRGLRAKEYRAKLGRLNLGIPFSIFRRNVLLAAGRMRAL